MSTINFKYVGPTYKNCKPSAAQQQALATDTSWQKTLDSSYSTVFGAASSMYKGLKSVLDGVVSSTSAFSAPVLASMNAQTLNRAAASIAKINAAISRGAAKGSVTPGVESGIVQAEKAGAATQVMTNMGNEQAEITQKNAELAIQERDKAINAEENLGKVFEPANQIGGEVTKANQVTADQANINAQESRSWMGMVGGLADAAVGGLTGGIGGVAKAAKGAAKAVTGGNDGTFGGTVTS